MITFCCVCRGEIGIKRFRRGANTCGPACAEQLRAWRRQERSQRFCRHCGREARKPKAVEPALTEPQGMDIRGSMLKALQGYSGER